MNEEMINWLISSDPSIAWQTMQVLNFDIVPIKDTRNAIETKGWGKRLLDMQQNDGSWSEGMYSPKFTSTTYTLLLLKRLGINQINSNCQIGVKLLFSGLRPDGGINFSPKENARSETCITGMIFNLLSYFEIEDTRLELIYTYLEQNQMEDGGWNCKYPHDATHASFNTTMLVLEGLQSFKEYQKKRKRNVKKIDMLEQKGKEFLLNHRLFKSHTTGEIVKADYLRFPFPYQWKYDILTALDYFQATASSYDERLQDAIHVVESKTKNGYLPNFKGQSGKLWFTMETIGKPSTFNTLRWQRVAKWWNTISK